MLTDTPLARERCSLPEIYELLDGINLGLTDQNISGRVQMRYHRGHPFFLKRKRAIHGFEEASIRRLDREVELDEI